MKLLDPSHFEALAIQCKIMAATVGSIILTAGISLFGLVDPKDADAWTERGALYAGIVALVGILLYGVKWTVKYIVQDKAAQNAELQACIRSNTAALQHVTEVVDKFNQHWEALGRDAIDKAVNGGVRIKQDKERT